MRLGALVILCGCDAIYGIGHATEAPPLDAHYFDAHVDAPYACPSSGAPAFSPYVHQLYVQQCWDYNTSADGAIGVANCSSPAQRVGSNMMLTPIPGLMDPGMVYGSPQVAPEGDTLLVLQALPMATSSTLEMYTRNSDDSWTAAGTVGTASQSLIAAAKIGAPSRGPLRHVMLLNADGNAHELVLDGAGGTEPHQYAPATLGVDVFDSVPAFTPDGLHIVFAATAGLDNLVFYSSRVSIDDAFTAAVATGMVGNIFDAFITADCGELYFSAVGSVMYVKG